MPLRLPISGFKRSSDYYGYHPLIPPPTTRRRTARWGSSELTLVGVFFGMTIIIYVCLASYNDYKSVAVVRGRAMSRNIVPVSNRMTSGAKRKLKPEQRVVTAKNPLEEPPLVPGQKVSLAERYRAKEATTKTFSFNEDLAKQKAGPLRHYYLFHKCLTAFGMSNRSDDEVSLFSKSADFNDCILDNEMAVRRRVVSERCQAFKKRAGNTTYSFYQTANSSSLFVLQSRQLVWCPVFKAASTNWMKTIPMLTNYLPKQIQLLKIKFNQANDLARFLAHPLDPAPFTAFMSHRPRPVTFLIARHPLDRLLSAYRDKLEIWRDHFYLLHGEPIVARYRKKGIARFGSKFYSKENNYGSPTPTAERTGQEPTFWEFCRAIIDERWPGNHWDPVYQRCSLCSRDLQYDFILKFESLAEEERYMLRALGLDAVVHEKWENRNRIPLTRETRIAYFSQLSDDELTSLYEIYRPDFDVFEYEFNVSRYRN